MDADELRKIRSLAKAIRIHCLRMTSGGGSSHVGSAFSCADILASLYGSVMRFDPAVPKSPARDRFVMSKGHAGAAAYAALAESGFMPVSMLNQHYRDGSKLSGHISHKGIPGVELSTGSLGHGLPVASGMALALKRGGGAQRVFVLLSDGEMDEGSNWESILFSAHHRLGNLTAVVDYNKIQSLGPVSETLALEPFTEKWRSFGWSVNEVDGHDHAELSAALGRGSADYRPRVVIAHTVKGKGVSFMEHSVLWHYRTARGDEFDRALTELEAFHA